MRFLKLLFILGLFVVLLGMARLYVYYEQFGINITRFLGFTEILASFFDLVIMGMGLTGLMLILWLMQERTEEKQKKYEHLLEKVSRLPGFMARVPAYIKMQRAFVVFLSVLLVFFIFYDNVISVRDDHYPAAIVIYLLTIGYLVVAMEFKIAHKKGGSSEETRTLVHFGCWGLVCMGAVPAIGFFEAAGVKHGNTTSITFENSSVFVSNTDDYYIGNTQGYVFIYHALQKRTEVLPMSRVKAMSFPADQLPD